ncbi:MAG: Mycofactocin system glycosyltransferase [Acidimicrobiaceae bacterium]|nr:Mycofactocin system glycosyltransferase [Acidimicrobiaceae bacterium]
MPPADAPIPEGTAVELDDRAEFIDRDLLSGGSPWRLLRLRGPSRALAEKWRGGGVVGAGEGRFARTLVQQGLLRPRFTSTGVLDVEAIDVVVPVVDNVDALAALLSQLDGFHVTITDDGSLDADAVARCAHDHGAILVRLHDNTGPAGARNAAARVTSRDLLWFIDVDVVMADPRVAAEELARAFVDPLVAAAAPRVRGAGGPTWRERFEVEFSPLDMGDRSALVVPGGVVSYVPSACLMVRRTAFGSGFDETLRVGEDVDLVWRLVDQGWLVRYDADVVVTHHARASWKRWWRQRREYGASTGELAKRHGSRLAPLRADPWTLLAWTSVLLGQPALGARVVRSARQHAREQFFDGEDDPEYVANVVVTRNMVRAGGPLARACARTFGVGLLLAAIHPRLRRRALTLFLIGTAWRWRHRRFHAGDVPLALADDLAYGVGVAQGAWRSKSLRALTPHITKSSLRWGEVLGLPRAGGFSSF